MEYYSTLKRNELPSHEKTWRKLKFILLNERSQFEKPTLRHSGKGKIMGIVKRLVVAMGCGQGEVNRQISEDF